MTLIATVIPELNSGQALTKVRICVLQILITILNQVQNDGTAVVILTNPPAGGLNSKVEQRTFNF